LAWVLLTWLHQVRLNYQLNKLLKAANNPDRAQSRHAAGKRGRDASIGDIIRDLPPVAR